MKYKKHIILAFFFNIIISLSFAQSFLVLEKMGTKKRFVYNLGQQIDFQLKGHKSIEHKMLTNISDSAFISNNDTIPFNSVKLIHIGNKRKSGIASTAGPGLVAAGALIVAIDAINRGLIQDGGYTWDTGVGATSAALVTSGSLIMILKKNKKNLSENSWWRLRKAEIYK